MRRADWLQAAVGGAVLIAAGCSASPERAIPSLQPATLNPSPVAGPPRATLLEKVILRAGGPDGPMLAGDGGNVLAVESGRELLVLGEPEAGADGTYVRAWILPSTTIWPGDFVAWVPATRRDGRPTLAIEHAAPCPAVATIGALAPLMPADRLRCAGSQSLTFDARSWFPVEVPSYDTDPAWYGTNADLAGSTSLFDPGPALFGPDARISPQAAGAWIDARVPPDVQPPPLGVYLRVTGQFDHPSAAGCRRSLPNGAANLGLPVEAGADSVRWCQWQFVVTGWQALVGSEGRPIDLNDPQLHRREFRPPPGVVIACAGVGMPPLTVRIDPSQAEPVWIETPGGRRSVAQFGPEFRLLLNPARVQSTTGVTLVDREVLDPDRGKPGISICPGGAVITFSVGP
jgi:hypothetical protein